MDQLMKILIPILLWNFHQVTANYTAPGKIVAAVFFLLGLILLFVCFLVLKKLLYFNFACIFKKQCYLS